VTGDGVTGQAGSAEFNPATAALIKGTAADTVRQLVDRQRRDSAYANYELAREQVLAMKNLVAESGSSGAPSEYWSEELGNIDYMLDASPLVVAKLRRHCYHITGIWPYNYRTHKDRAQEQHAEKLRALIEVGDPELLVHEPPILGGFGFELDGGLVNLDTLKFFEVLIALERGAVLGGLRERRGRSYVWEIGAGWGGFAYQFKRLFPDTTYVIVDLPELFLFSATYLMTAFPDARVAFFGRDGSAGSELPWDADFVFIPNTALEAVVPPRLDLTLNMVSFQEMTTDQVEAYVAHAYVRECPYLYSLNRERSLYNPELSGVTQIMNRYYWPHPVEVLPVSYVTMLDAKTRKKVVKDGKRHKRTPVDALRQDLDYKHVVGWRRLHR
jgi:hypothetical protein